MNLLRAKVGMVFQKPTPFPMTIYENVAFGVRALRAWPAQGRSRRTTWIIACAVGALWDEVKDKLDTSGLSLSGGQQQRLCIARTIAIKPEVILLDEPCSALDPISTAKIEELIDVLKRDYTIAIVTHNMQQAARTSRLYRLYVSRRACGVRQHHPNFHQSKDGAHAGLHHRPLRLGHALSRRTRKMETHEHIVRSYEEELSALNNKIAKMGGLAEQVLGQSIDALEGRDPDLAAATIQQDEAIDALETEIEEQVITMIARRQPMAYDLRQIMAALRISTDLERIGDLGKNIAKRALAVVGEQQPKQLMLGLKHMGELALGQLKEVLDAYIERDADRALRVWYTDEDIDAMYNSLFRELLTYMMEDPRNIGLCTHLLFGAKNIERIGDHATNIAETVYFLVHGRPITDQRPKSDTTSSTPVALRSAG